MCPPVFYIHFINFTPKKNATIFLLISLVVGSSPIATTFFVNNTIV